MFLIVELQQTPQSDVVQSFSSKVMQWSELQWLWDLRLFLNYWQRQARQENLDVATILRRLVHRLWGESDNANVVTMQQPFRAVLCAHPWQGLVLLEHMRQRSLSGWLSAYSEFGQQCTQQITWDAFWKASERVVQHWLRLETKGLCQQGFASERERCQRAMERLGIKTPAAFLRLPTSGVERRFGKRCRLLAEWFFSKNFQAETFPWEDWQPPAPPTVKRHCDFAMQTWDQMAPLLALDFERLSQQAGRVGVKTIYWDMVLENCEIIRVPILFTYPHIMQQESESHPTALAQAGYQFERLQQREQPAVVDDGVAPLSIVSWQLVLTESIVLQPRMVGLFQDHTEGGDEERFYQLANQLPVSLWRFNYQEDWYPEDSYTDWNDTALSDQRLPSYVALGEQRPLFMYKRPQPLAAGAERWQLLESTVRKWWLKPDNQDLERRYYRVQTRQGQALWVYCDGPQQWFCHGVFG